jgi:hypothetical protein
MDSQISGKMLKDVPCSTASLFAGCALWACSVPHARIWAHTHNSSRLARPTPRRRVSVDQGGDCVVMIPERCMHAWVLLWCLLISLSTSFRVFVMHHDGRMRYHARDPRSRASRANVCTQAERPCFEK